MTSTEHALRLRPGVINDAKEVGKIIFEAFSGIADKHGFPREFPTIDIGINTASSFLSNPGFYSVVAEDTEGDGNKVIGSNFLDERSNTVTGVGPLTVDPKSQNKGVGKQLMSNVMERARSKNYPAIRLLQASYHNRSLALYTRLGFDVREPISTLQGKPIQEVIPGRTVRVATDSDLETCNAICRVIHGHDRNGEIKDSIKQGIAKVVLHGEKITGYTSGLTYFNHSVGFTNDDLKALIASETTTTDCYGGPGILIPTRNAELFRWCLENKLRLVHQLTLMTIGMYNEPAGYYMPSILY
ncbi:MAG: GNAT family N-acetyltransferase [Candidatus Nitrosocosmicus sp.]|nr:GNAT family N-acetyltransferase [Candidatus Nitrosocosmicus sp.]MDN5869068.1 GNAT family N-acetyltransferase [Candidatus Nitrosocosmicus sp.]